jgi:hypothetical protein
MGWQKFTSVGDNHGDKIDPVAEAAFFSHLKDWKPDIRIHAGDNFDLRPLRHGASKEEKEESMRVDIAAGKRFLKRYSPHYFLRGNHDERLWELAAHGKGGEGDYGQQGVEEVELLCRQLKCKVLPYHKRDGVLRLGHLKILHGFYCGVYAARQHASTYGSCLFGHVHTIQEFSIPGLEHRVARSIGCLASLDMDYLTRRPESLKHAHGWAYGVINDKTGDYFCWQAECINGKFIVTEGFKEL